MLKVFTGTDSKKARSVLNKAILSLNIGNSGAIYRFSDIDFDPSKALQAVTDVSLFADKNIVVFEGILSSPLGKAFFERQISHLMESPNAVFIFEEKIPTELRDVLSKVAHIEEFHQKTPASVFRKSDNFIVANAVAARDKRAAWVAQQRALRSGSSAEELHGIVSWAVKTLVITKERSRDDAVSSGVSPNSYSQYKNGSKNYLSGELECMLTELKDMYHASHSGEGDLEHELELFLLGI